MANRILMDTDIGSDVDDMVTLVYLLKSGMSLEAVITTHGDARLRAKIAKKVINSLGKNIPVAYGNDRPLISGKIYTFGFEGNGIIFPDDTLDISPNFLQLMKTTIERYPNEINILSIAPMTNLASLFKQYPEVIPKIKQLYFMGTVDQYGYPDKVSHNVKVDPEAAEFVFRSGVPITSLPTEVAKKAFFDKQDLEKIRSLGKEWAQYLYRNAVDGLAAHAEYGVCHLYDPMTLGMLDRPELFEMEKRGNVTVARDVDGGKFKQYLLDILEK